MTSLRGVSAVLIASSLSLTTVIPATSSVPSAPADAESASEAGSAFGVLDASNTPEALLRQLPAGGDVAAAHRGSSGEFLTEPFLQNPTKHEVSVVWFTEEPRAFHYVMVGSTSNPGPRLKVVPAKTTKLSRTAEDAKSKLPDDQRPTEEQGVVARDVYRHEARVTGLPDSVKVPYRAVSVRQDGYTMSDEFTLRAAPRPDDELNILLTSDHQAKDNTPANLQWAKETLGNIDAVFMAGDLVNIPDRASEWFDSTDEKAFFPGLLGTSQYEAKNSNTYTGGEILQHAPIYPVIGNHEVMGARGQYDTLSGAFANPVPKDVASKVYDAQHAGKNDPAHKAKWMEDNSYSTTTYEEVFSLPTSKPGGEKYYATTVGNTRLIALYVTRIWRSTLNDANPADREKSSRYQESAAHLDDPMKQAHGTFPFESIAVGSEQHSWLVDELASDATSDAENVVVMLHESPQTLGDNAMPHFAEPVRIEEKDADGTVTGVRYEYPADQNMVVRDVFPVLEDAGVDLVLNGHNHVWNRFVSPGGTNYLETGNVGNTYGAYDVSSGKSRPVPNAPWNADNIVPQGSVGGLTPQVPTVNPMTDEAGKQLPFVSSNDHTVFSALNTKSGTVTSWIVDMTDPNAKPEVLDEFSLNQK